MLDDVKLVDTNKVSSELYMQGQDVAIALLSEQLKYHSQDMAMLIRAYCTGYENAQILFKEKLEKVIELTVKSGFDCQSCRKIGIDVKKCSGDCVEELMKFLEADQKKLNLFIQPVING